SKYGADYVGFRSLSRVFLSITSRASRLIRSHTSSTINATTPEKNSQSRTRTASAGTSAGENRFEPTIAYRTSNTPRKRSGRTVAIAHKWLTTRNARPCRYVRLEAAKTKELREPKILPLMFASLFTGFTG